MVELSALQINHSSQCANKIGVLISCL